MPGLVDSSSEGADAGLQGGQPSPVDSSSSEEDGGRKGSKDPDGKGKGGMWVVRYKGGGISDGKGKDTYNPQDPDGNDTVRGKGQGKSKDKTRARGGGEQYSEGPFARGKPKSNAPLAVEGCGDAGRPRVKAPPVGLAPPCPGSHPTVKAPPPVPSTARVKAPPVGLAPPRPGSHPTVKAHPPSRPSNPAR
jgi:hypothetical protein